MGAIPFEYVLDDAALVAQMIAFDDRLPAIWEYEWERMRRASSLDLEGKPIVTSRDTLPGFANCCEDTQVDEGILQTAYSLRAHETSLAPMFPVIQGLMRFMPFLRISANRAFHELLEAPNELGRPVTAPELHRRNNCDGYNCDGCDCDGL